MTYTLYVDGAPLKKNDTLYIVPTKNNTGDREPKTFTVANIKTMFTGSLMVHGTHGEGMLYSRFRNCALYLDDWSAEVLPTEHHVHRTATGCALARIFTRPALASTPTVQAPHHQLPELIPYTGVHSG